MNLAKSNQNTGASFSAPHIYNPNAKEQGDGSCNNFSNQKIISADLPVAKLKEIMPQGVKALFLSANDTLKRDISRYYPLDLSLSPLGAGESKQANKEFLPGLGNAFLPISGRTNDRKSGETGVQNSGKNLPSTDKQNLLYYQDILAAIRARDFDSILKNIDFAENIRFVISEGEYIPFGKYIANQLNLKHIICGGGNLSSYEFAALDIQNPQSITNTDLQGLPQSAADYHDYNPPQDAADYHEYNSIKSLKNQSDYSYINGGVTPEFFNPTTNEKMHLNQNLSGIGYAIKKYNQADAIIFNFDNINVASGFAFVLSSYLALFDWDISALLFGGNMCGEVFCKVQKTVDRLMAAAGMFNKKSSQLKKAVLQAQISMAELIDTAGLPLLISGAGQAAAALFALFKHEERPLIDFFDMTFLLAPTVAKIYSAFLQHELTFCPPPDNNFRASRINEYLGVDESLALFGMPDYLCRRSIELTDYRLGIYRDELRRHIYSVLRVLDSAYPVYFKLFDDDGFFLRGYIGSLDYSLAIGLGSDVLRGDTLLSYIRAKGLLDRFIV